MFLEARYCINLCKKKQNKQKQHVRNSGSLHQLTVVLCMSITPTEKKSCHALVNIFSVSIPFQQKAESCPDLIAIDHQLVCGGEGLEDYHPASVGGPLKKCFSQLRDVDIHFICALDQV